MTNFYVRVEKRDGGAAAPGRLRLTPVRCTWAAVGGPQAAEIAADGAAADLEGVFDLLGCKVIIHAPDGTPVWWGLVQEAALTQGGAEWRLSLEEVANRIAVAYTLETEDGSFAAQTAWMEDSRSIEQWGRRELLYSLGSALPEQAQAAAVGLLAAKAFPSAAVKAAQTGETRAALHCIGFWETLRWRCFTQAAGRIVHAGANTAEALVGWAVQAADDIGFDARLRRIHHLGAALGALRAGDRLTVAGSASNDGAYTVVEVAGTDKQVVYAAAAARFDPTDDLMDGGERLDHFRAGEMLHIQDSVNAGFWFIKSVSPDHITLHPPEVAAEGVNVVVLTQGNSVAVAEPLTLERPALGSRHISLTAHGVKLAQSFIVPSADRAWTAGEVVLTARRVGSPADALKVELCADAGGVPGAVLDGGAAAAASLPVKSAASVSLRLSRSAQLAPGARVWLVVSRTGTADSGGCFCVGLDADAGLADGALLQWTGSGWEARTPAASLNFQVWGEQETTQQIADAVYAAGGPLMTVSVRAASGVWTRQHRSGRGTALAEVEKLLAAGSAAGRRLLAWTTLEGAVVIDEAPDPALANLRWRGGRIVTGLGRDLPPGYAPVGQWVRFDDAPARAEPALIERAELDAAAGRLTPDFSTAGSVWDIGGVRQG